MSGIDAPDEEQSNVTESPDFPPFPGSFVLVASDGLRFHTRQYLLEHVSGFFRDMFSLPTKESELPTRLDSATLSDLLCLIDPVKRSPTMKASTISHLIEAARFYQIPFIVTWFEDSVLRGSTDATGNMADQALVQTHPLLVLTLSHQLGLLKCVEAALKEFRTCHADKLTENIDIVFRVYLHSIALRNEQVEVCLRLINELSEHETSRKGNIKDLSQEISTCFFCTAERGQWFERLTTTAFTHPNWTALGKILRDFPVCNRGCPSDRWVSRMEGIIVRHEVGIMRPQSRLESIWHDPGMPLVPEWLKEAVSANARMNAE